MSHRVAVVVLMSMALASQAACSSDDPGDGAANTTTTTVDRPAGPAAELAPLEDGRGVNLGASNAVDLEAVGWVEKEYSASGSATAYKAVGELPSDGTFELEPDASADYTTRVVVRRPAEEADFNGTVVVEWLNVTAGSDAGPHFTYAADELVRGGYAWVGVSAQVIGVEGGQSAVAVAGAPTGGLKAADPERYGDLHHPGDAFAYDIYTQVGRALREPGEVDALDGLVPEHLLAVGESQSAFALTTYVNGVQPLTWAFDGFLVHSRGGAAGPLLRPGEEVDIAATLGGPPTQIRTDGDAPVLVLESEGDVLGILGYLPARQPDSERFRLWEVAGSAHADAYIVGPGATAFDCGAPINDGPQHFVVKAALRSLDTWVRTGEAPPEAPRLEVDESGSSPAFVRDADGNVRGGIRTPQLDVPVAVLSGDPGDTTSLICLLSGQTRPFPTERLAELYPSADDYLAAYEDAADEAVAAGFVLEDDREVLLGDAQPDAIPGG